MSPITTVAVVVARLQVDALHIGHHHLIEQAQSFIQADALMICLGDRDKVGGGKHPLPFQVRKQMVLESYPQATVVRLMDTPSDERWSQQLDDLIWKHFPHCRPTLFCSRDGFKDYYSGRHQVEVIDPIESLSGTDIRASIASDLQNTSRQNADFRRGYIAAHLDRHPIVFSTVDVAVMNHDRSKIWLGQKEADCGSWRFPGGFVDPTDATRVAAAVREATEELGNIKLDNPVYIGSAQVTDLRYADEADAIMTDLFLLTHTWGQAVASDDLDEIGWFAIEDIMQCLVDAHKPLGQMLLNHIKKGA